MDFSFSPQQEELREQARSFLAARRSAGPAQGWDPASWAELAGLGWLGVSAPEAAGGAGLTFVEESILIEEMGRALYPGPYLATIALAAPALGDERLAEVVRGERRWSARLGGEAALVPDLDKVDLVAVHRDGQMVAVPARGEAVESIDPTRSLGRLEAGCGEVLLKGEEAAAAARLIELRMTVGLALEAVGVAQRALELGLEHACSREQFGKLIGTYQAVSHRLVDSHLEVELARSLACWAAWCVAEGEEDAALAGAAARSAAADAAVAACERSIQVCGGMGFTWESPLHRLYRRALWIARFGGSPAQQREAVAAALLDR
ncbi:MAG: acyl-CoA dehydrogenase family protein [Candidatus Dormibacteraceae bacterium]